MTIVQYKRFRGESFFALTAEIVLARREKSFLRFFDTGRAGV
jgi:hypothetical protein